MKKQKKTMEKIMSKNLKQINTYFSRISLDCIWKFIRDELFYKYLEEMGHKNLIIWKKKNIELKPNGSENLIKKVELKKKHI